MLLRFDRSESHLYLIEVMLIVSGNAAATAANVQGKGRDGDHAISHAFGENRECLGGDAEPSVERIVIPLSESAQTRSWLD